MKASVLTETPSTIPFLPRALFRWWHVFSSLGLVTSDALTDIKSPTLRRWNPQRSGGRRGKIGFLDWLCQGGEDKVQHFLLGSPRGYKEGCVAAFYLWLGDVRWGFSKWRNLFYLYFNFHGDLIRQSLWLVICIFFITKWTDCRELSNLTGLNGLCCYMLILIPRCSFDWAFTYFWWQTCSTLFSVLDVFLPHSILEFIYCLTLLMHFLYKD